MAAKSYPYKQWNVQSTAGGYWEDSSNWKSANSANSKFNNGYVIGELSTAKSKVVKFRSAVNAGSVLLSIGGNGISRSGSAPIVFCADQDDYGITVGNLDVGEWGYGYLAIERGTYVDNGYLYVRNPVNTSDATFRVGGTGENALLDISSWIGIGQDGRYPAFMEIGNGGTVRCLALYPGVAQNQVATLTVTAGGKFENAGTGGGEGFGLIVARDVNGTLNVNGGFVDLHALPLHCGYRNSASATVNITDGGVIRTSNIVHGNGGSSGTTVITLDGGTLKAGAANSVFVENDAKLTVAAGSNGATFDADGYDITIPKAITGTGAVKFTGSGSTITLSQEPGWTGGTKIDLGTTVSVPTKAILSSGLEVIAPVFAEEGDYTVFTCTAGGLADGDLANVTLSAGNASMTASVVGGNSIVVHFVPPQTRLAWNATGTNWGDTGAWTDMDLSAAADWIDGAAAFFNTANATATLAADVSAKSLSFGANAAISGSSTLTVPQVDVASGVTVSIDAPTAGALEKTGAGTLVLGLDRSAATVLSAGTIAMSGGATLDWSRFTPGANVAVVFTNGTSAYPSTMPISGDAMPSVLTIEKDAVVQATMIEWNAAGESTVNIKGGTVRTTSQADSFFMDASIGGRLDVNLTDGALLEIAGESRWLTCSSAVGGSTAFGSPKMNVKVLDSTIRVVNGKSLSFGLSGSTYASATPELTFAATNSTIDSAWGFYFGNTKKGLPSEGFFRGDLEHCVVTGMDFAVFSDRAQNHLRVNGTRFVFRSTQNRTPQLRTDDGEDNWITIGEDGLIFDTQNYSSYLLANPARGKIVKVGTGTLTVDKNLTATSAFEVDAGTLALSAGISVARAVRIADGAKLSLTGTAQNTVTNLAFAAGSTLNIAAKTIGVVPLAVASLSLPDSGTVALTYAGGAFPKGQYPVYSRAGVTVADGAKFAPSTGSLAYEWRVKDDTLYLNVDVGAFTWTGSAGDGKISTPGNWAGWTTPGAGDTLDLALVAADSIITADMPDVVFATVISPDTCFYTLNGELHVDAITNTFRMAVNTGAKLKVDGDLVLTGDCGYGDVRANHYVLAKNLGSVEVGGSLILEADSTCSDRTLLYYWADSTGTFKVGGVENRDENRAFCLCGNHATQIKWLIGAGGMRRSAATTRGFSTYAAANGEVTLQAYADFEVAAPVSATSNIKFDTTAPDGSGKTITVKRCFEGSATVTVTGTGKMIVDSTGNGTWTATGALAVSGTATLAINPGKLLTNGAITMSAETTLEVPESGTVALGGNLTLASGSTLAFKVADNSCSVLARNSKTITLPESGKVTVKLTADSLPKVGSPYTLTSGAGLTDADESKFELADGVGGSLSVSGGELVYTAPAYFYIKISESDAGEFKINPAWFWAHGGLKFKDTEKLAADIAQSAPNGYTYLQNYLLGYEPDDPASKLRIDDGGDGGASGNFTLNCTFNVPNVEPESGDYVVKAKLLSSADGQNFTAVEGVDERTVSARGAEETVSFAFTPDFTGGGMFRFFA